MNVKRGQTSESITRSMILKSINRRSGDSSIELGSFLDSTSNNREEYLKRGAFIFIIIGLIGEFISIILISFLYLNNLANYLTFLIAYFPGMTFMILGGFFMYFEKQTAQGQIVSFNKFHLILSVIITLFTASTFAAMPFLEGQNI